MPARKTVPKKVTEEKKVIPKGCIVAEGGIYLAERSCTFGISYFTEGKTPLHTKKGDIIPYHFIKKKVYQQKVTEEEEANALEAEDM